MESSSSQLSSDNSQMDETVETEFFIATGLNVVEDIKMFIKEGVNVNEVFYNDEPPLVVALRKDCANYEIVKRLLEAGADVNYQSPNGNGNPLIIALESDCSEEILNLLINTGSDVNAKSCLNMSVLMYAIQYNHSKEIIGKLISKGADVNYSTSGGWTPLYYAVNLNRNVEICKMLISAGADIYAREFINDQNILMKVACKNCSVSDCLYKDVIDLLVNYDLLKDTDSGGNTIMHIVPCSYLINKAVENGISIDATNYESNTPLMETCLYGKNFEKVKNLLGIFKANPNCVDDNLNTPLHIEDNLCSITNMLLYHGADLLASNNLGYTPLESLLRSRFDDVIVKENIKSMAKHYLLFINDDIYSFLLPRYGVKNYSTVTDMHCVMTLKRIILYFDKFINQCKIEVDKMKQLLFKNDLTIFDFCQLKRLYGSEFVDVSFNENELDREKMIETFPIYNDLILTRIKDNNCCTKYNKILLNCLERVFVRSYSDTKTREGVLLPRDCLYLIGLHLNGKEIFNLFYASFQC